jgi:hypothetical protein
VPLTCLSRAYQGLANISQQCTKTERPLPYFSPTAGTQIMHSPPTPAHPDLSSCICRGDPQRVEQHSFPGDALEIIGCRVPWPSTLQNKALGNFWQTSCSLHQNQHKSMVIDQFNGKLYIQATFSLASTKSRPLPRLLGGQKYSQRVASIEILASDLLNLKSKQVFVSCTSVPTPGIPPPHID